MNYYKVTVVNWDGGDQTWKTYKIFKTRPAAEKFNKLNKGKLATQGWETNGVEICVFAEFE